MPRIKTNKYDFNGEEIKVHFNCSTSGVFSTNLHVTLREKLGIDKERLEGTSLEAIEKVVDNAFYDYKNANTSYKLKIGLRVAAAGKFKYRPDGEPIEQCLRYGSPFSMSMFSTSMDSAIAMDYRILIEENRDGRVTLHTTEKKGAHRGFHDDNQEVDGYVITGGAHIANNEKILDYNEGAVQRLEEITKQLRRASAFLIDMASSEDLLKVLTSGTEKTLLI